MTSPFRNQFLNYGQAPLTPTPVKKPDAYTPYAAGAKQYGVGARTNPTSGPISPLGMEGYRNRDQRAAVARQASLNMLQAQQRGSYASPDWLGGQVRGY